MARSGLFREVPTPQDQALQSIQKNLIDALNVLTSDDDILRVPIVTYPVTSVIPAGKSVVAFTGVTGQTLTLPPAASQGVNISSLLAILNTSANTLTITPSAGNTVSGGMSITVATGMAVILVSDGISKWLKAV